MLDESHSLPYPMVYDFVFDRLRAVRQDLVVQGYLGDFVNRKETSIVIHILETCVRFYVYSESRYFKKKLNF